MTAAAAASASASPPRAALPTFDDDDEDEQDPEEAARLAALEYTEDGVAMGSGQRSPSPSEQAPTVQLALPNTAQRFTPSHLARMPLFLRTEAAVFQPETYKSQRKAILEQEEADGVQMDEKAKDVERRIRCENTLRWKVSADGSTRRSNSRFVRWSDGSWTLQVGKEQFDISGLDTRYAGSKEMPTQEINGNAASQPASQPRPVAAPAASSRALPQPLTYIATLDRQSSVYQTLQPLHSSISMQPTSLQSATHRLISSNLSSIRAKSSTSKVTMSELITGEKAPEEVKRERERKLMDEERRRKLRKKREEGADIVMEEEAELAGLYRGRRRAMIDEVRKSNAVSRTKRLTTGTRLDDDDDEEAGDEGEYEDEEEEDRFIVPDVEDEEEDAEGEDDDGSEEEGQTTSKKGSSLNKAKRARKGDDDMDIDQEEELDDLEKADQAIERQRQAKKQADAAHEGASLGEADAPVQRKKAAVIDSEDEDE